MMSTSTAMSLRLMMITVIASSGIVKALGVCLGTKDSTPRTQSKNNSPTGSGAATPRQGPLRGKPSKKPRDVSFELCEGARKIRARLKPALIKQDKEGNDYEFREYLPSIIMCFTLMII